MDEFGGYPHDSGNPPRLVHVRPRKTTKLSGSPTQAISAEERRRRDTWSPACHDPGMPRIGAVRGQGVWSQHRPLDILGCFSQTHLSLGVSCVSKERVTSDPWPCNLPGHMIPVGVRWRILTSSCIGHPPSSCRLNYSTMLIISWLLGSARPLDQTLEDRS